MSPLHFLSLSLHVLAAIVWLGGMFFFALVGAPVLRKVEPASLRSALLLALGPRFRWIGRVNAVVGIAVVLAAIRLARGA